MRADGDNRLECEDGGVASFSLLILQRMDQTGAVFTLNSSTMDYWTWQRGATSTCWRLRFTTIISRTEPCAAAGADRLRRRAPAIVGVWPGTGRSRYGRAASRPISWQPNAGLLVLLVHGIIALPRLAPHPITGHANSRAPTHSLCEAIRQSARRTPPLTPAARRLPQTCGSLRPRHRSNRAA
jgi:hypothetical protein